MGGGGGRGEWGGEGGKRGTAGNGGMESELDRLVLGQSRLGLELVANSSFSWYNRR